MATSRTSGQQAAPPGRGGVAFLLAQLGAFAAERFGERAAALDFTRPQAGLLRVIAQQPGSSQQTIAAMLGTPPSRLVALVDGLEQRGLLERRRNAVDRRNYELHLTAAGRDAMRELGTVGAEHEAAITSPLTRAERDELGRLLGKLADAHGLTPGVHPGYRKLTRADDERHRPADPA
jgi:DNA-binding MarR family transcriptional regulator